MIRSFWEENSTLEISVRMSYDDAIENFDNESELRNIIQFTNSSKMNRLTN